MSRPALSLLLVPTLLVGACASADGRYPSLAVRDIERVEGEFEPVATEPLDVPEVPVAYEGTLEDRLSMLVNDARAAHSSFLEIVPSATRLVEAARGSEVASDAWASAQVALAELDSARSQSAISLGELDTLHVAATVQAEERAQIEAARDTVIALVIEEDETLALLRGEIGR